MNKKELVEAVSVKKELTKKEAEDLVDTVFDTITDSLLEGNKVLISGFGTFKVNHRKERKGVSPKTKEIMTIPASKTLTFKPSNRLKDSMNS
ncbi:MULTISPECIES: HU family DNA-binding protein [Beduini]|uniref:HU family DNA-binding protein n=1 Tax=Beduini TaxID=1922299 RepID=UPI00059AB283|nr:HU family DNA-binding protein [Beduini massiliensis]